MVFMKFTHSFLNQIPCIATSYKQICTGKNMGDLQVKLQNWGTMKFCLAVIPVLLRYLTWMCSFSSGSHLMWESLWKFPSEINISLKISISALSKPLPGEITYTSSDPTAVQVHQWELLHLPLPEFSTSVFLRKGCAFTSPLEIPVLGKKQVCCS